MKWLNTVFNNKKRTEPKKRTAVPIAQMARNTYNVVVLSDKILIIAKDLPRLMTKMEVNKEKVDASAVTINEKLESILMLVHVHIHNDVGIPTRDHLVQNNDKVLALKQTFSSCESKDLEKHEFLLKKMLEVFPDSHPVFNVLRACNQNAVGQPIVYLKTVLMNDSNLEFKDNNWFIRVQSTSNPDPSDETKYIQTVQVTHDRGERVLIKKDVQLLQWFTFRWSIIFTFTRSLTLDDPNRETIPLQLSEMELKYTGVEEYNNSVHVPKHDRKNFGNFERVNNYMNKLFANHMRKIDFTREIDQQLEQE